MCLYRKDVLVSEERVFGPRLAVIPCLLLPLPATDVLDAIDRSVPGICRSCSGLRRNGVLEWRDDDPCAAFRECFVDGILVVRSVAGEAHDLLVVWNLIEKVRGDACIIGRAVGQCLGHNHTVFIDTNVKLPPLPRSPLAVCGRCPRAFADDLSSSTVDHKMDRGPPEGYCQVEADGRF